MKFFRRVNGLIAAQVNEVVESWERPELMLKQAIREMQSALQSATEWTAKSIAAEKRLKQQAGDEQAQAKRWRERAAEYLRAGREEAARAAIAAEIEREQSAHLLEGQVTAAEQTSRRLKQQLSALRGRLSDARRQLSSLVARQHAAEAQREFLKSMGNFDVEFDSSTRFDELARRVLDNEAEAEAIAELCGVEVEPRPSEFEIEARLDALRKENASPEG